jgi:hypothetical protein
MINFNSNITSLSPIAPNSNVSKKVNENFTSIQNSSRPNQSTIPALKDRFISMIDKYAQTESAANKLLDTFSQPSTSGFILGGLPDITSPDIMARHDRIAEKFKINQQDFEQQKTTLINEGLADGKSAKVILNDIVELYDSQPELFKIGVGWNGQVFAFNESSMAGYQRVLDNSRDVVDMRA